MLCSCCQEGQHALINDWAHQPHYRSLMAAYILTTS